MSGFDSNSVSKALQGAAPSGDHPDADLLAAFAEGTLLRRERQSVMLHAAGCVECRRVLNLAARAAIAQPPTKAKQPKSPKWMAGWLWIPSLGAAAAVVLIVALVTRNEPARVDAPQSVATNVPATTSPAAAPVSANAQVEAAPTKSTNAVQAKKAVPQPQRSPAKNPAVGNNAALETAEIAPADAGRMQTQASVSAFSNAVTSKALATAAAALIVRPHWRLNDLGQPERAFGNGPWEQVLPNNSPRIRVLSIYAGQVWLGGEKSNVLRSFDNGARWQVVPLPEKNGKDHSIAHIRFESAGAITIDAADGTEWSSADGGETWK